MAEKKKPVMFDYSRYNTYKKCPQLYKWQYIENRLPKTPPNYYYAFPGIVIQKIFELFYNNEWFLKKSECREFMYKQAAEIYTNTLKYTTVDWNSKIAKKDKSQVYEELLSLIGKNLDVIKEKKLIGKFARSEYKIQSFFEDNKYVILTSKLDFMIHNKDGMQILDGKLTNSKANYLKNPAQLFFYAMIYKIKYGKYPDKIGFWFWRDGQIVYIDIDDTKIEELKEDIKKCLYSIYKQKFEPTPEYQSCLFCNYKDECLDRKKKLAEKYESSAVTAEDLKDFI